MLGRQVSGVPELGSKVSLHDTRRRSRDPCGCLPRFVWHSAATATVTATALAAGRCVSLLAASNQLPSCSPPLILASPRSLCSVLPRTDLRHPALGRYVAELPEDGELVRLREFSGRQSDRC